MSALATILLRRGHVVYGSDRSYDKGETPDKFALLEQSGMKLCPQDGTGVDQNIDVLVVSSAVENSIPDVRRALELSIPIQKRAELLAELVNRARGVCVGGTSGKTTVTGMIAHVLDDLGKDPTVMNGGQVINFLDKGGYGNARVGNGDLFVTETDESDGSIALFKPAIAVVNNITLDHKPLAELRPLFTDFIKEASEAAVINLDDPEAASLVGIHKNTITFSIDKSDADITASGFPLNLKVPGQHNLSNALAALSVMKVLNIPLKDAAKALENFKGIRRRFEVIGENNNIMVIDDFAHNPDKIEATLRTLKETQGRIFAVFQPHGFGPTKMMKEGLVKVFKEYLEEQDTLIMPEIYYAGGTADKTISSRDIIEAVKDSGTQAYFFESRDEIKDFLVNNAIAGDRIVIMGARDDTLSEFAQKISDSLKKKAA